MMDFFPFYSYLNLESTKTSFQILSQSSLFYSYLNLESTKTVLSDQKGKSWFYSYLNLESTKTSNKKFGFLSLKFII